MGVASSTVCAVGSGRIWTWRPGQRPPAEPGAARRQWLGLVYLRAGHAAISAGAEVVTLEAGDLALVDRRLCAAVATDAAASKLVLELPRHRVEARHALGVTPLCVKLPAGGGRAVLRDLLVSVQAEAPRLPDPGGGEALLNAAIELLAGVPMRGAERQRSGDATHARALALIRSSAIDPDLTASTLAARLGLSRRRLDEILASRGRSVHKEIWAQRLNWAADALCNSAPERQVIDVALSAGFKDAGHFARAFKRRFGCSPTLWRNRHAGRATPGGDHSSSR